MIDCPKCLGRFSGNKCGCGYVPKYEVSNTVQFARRQQDEKTFQTETRDWLKSRGIIKDGMSVPEKMKSCAAYRTRLKTAIPVAKAEPRAWAGEVLSRIAEGYSYPRYIEKMARDALNIPAEEKDAA